MGSTGLYSKETAAFCIYCRDSDTGRILSASVRQCGECRHLCLSGTDGDRPQCQLGRNTLWRPYALACFAGNSQESAAAELQGHLRHLWKDQKIGILCADEKNFTQHLYDTCGVFLEDQALCIVAGARHLPEFSALLERRGHFHNGLLRQEFIGLGRALVSPPPDIGATLLECSDMPHTIRLPSNRLSSARCTTTTLSP